MTSANKTSRKDMALSGYGEDQLTETSGRLDGAAYGEPQGRTKGQGLAKDDLLDLSRLFGIARVMS